MKLERQQQEENNPMKALENRTMESKKEMDILDALDEIRTKNARTERLNIDEVNEKILKRQQKTEEELLRLEEEEIDKIAKATFKTDDGENVKRIAEDVDDTDIKSLLKDKYNITSNHYSFQSSNSSTATSLANGLGIKKAGMTTSSSAQKGIAGIIKKRRPESDLVNGIVKKKATTTTTTTNTTTTTTTTTKSSSKNTLSGVVKKKTTTAATKASNTASAPAQNSLTSLFSAYDSDDDDDSDSS